MHIITGNVSRCVVLAIERGRVALARYLLLGVHLGESGACDLLLGPGAAVRQARVVRLVQPDVVPLHVEEFLCR